MKAYKLTDKNNQTHGKLQWGLQWGPNVSHTATGNSDTLCSDGYIHYYKDPLLAVLLNPIHANFPNPNLWECEATGVTINEPLKSGSKTVTTTRQIPLPEVTLTQRIAFAILCVKQVYKSTTWLTWADNWLAGINRTKQTAKAVADAAYAAYAVYAVADAADAKAAAYAAYAVAAVNSEINFALLAQEALKY